ncbi:acyltransferase family protein [Streptomyces sp. NRRL F-5126]|uniref:acyltransferase family protein n=1 Tax=Streptomyces sp. NRRL F-5126 TaxID=1463857 RepID=UPI0004C4EF1D|nr:acyltransferase [Streptomyces sp. NRRL F-5126]
MAQHRAAPGRSHPSPVPLPTPRAGRPHLAPLDGLRGLAVAAVLLFHAGYLRGGFLGVDLFFVLSGFLITGLLLAETRRAGGIDLAAFWARRARRLLPALVVMGVATLLLAWVFGSPSLLAFALDDAPWAAAQAVNWHFIAEQVGYWNASDTRLFSHLWSIAVEWQFYLAWPVVVLLAGRGRHGERRVASLAVVGACVSLALMIMFDTAVDTTRVYEGTDTRAFSLLLGAAVATRPVRAGFARVPRQAADLLCAVLACGLVASWALTDGQHAPGLFQGGMFLHSLVAAVLIATLAAVPDGRTGRALGSVVPRRLGELSYGLYLWHWPVYLLLPADVLGFGGPPRTAVLIALSLAAAALSKKLVEDPVRFRARWATSRRGLAVLGATALVAAAVWAAIPQPTLGAGSVDVHRLMEP